MRKLMLWSLIVLVSFLCRAGAARTGEWPAWRGAQHTGQAQSEVFNIGEDSGFKIVWKKKLGSGYSSVSVADGRAITMFSDGKADIIVALDAATGAELWRHEIDETYVGRAGSHDGPLSTPAIDDSIVYAIGPKGQIVALDAATGKTVWSTTMKDIGSEEPLWGWTTSPLIWRNLLILQTGGVEGKAVTALNKKTGAAVWASGDDSVAYQSPVVMTIHGSEHVVCAGRQKVVGLDPANGETLWELDHKGKGEDANPVAAGENRFFFPHSGREGMLVEVEKHDKGFTAREVWRSGGRKNTYNPSVYFDGHLFGYSGPFMVSIDAATGERVWRSREAGDGFTILVNDYLVILTKDGALKAAKAIPSGFEELVKIQLFDAPAWNPPSFAYGKVYIRSLTEIACVELATAEGTKVSEDKDFIIASEAEWRGNGLPKIHLKSVL